MTLLVLELAFDIWDAKMPYHGNFTKCRLHLLFKSGKVEGWTIEGGDSPQEIT